MEQSVPMETRKQRTKLLRALSLKKQRAHYETFVGSTRPVLFEESQEEGLRFGYTPEYVRVAVPESMVDANSIHAVQIEQIHAAGYASARLSNVSTLR